MPKYYVSSGNLSVTCNSDTPKNAAIIAFNRLKEKPVELGKLTVVSERGFNTDCEDDTFWITCDLLEETDQLDEFKLTEWIK